MSRVPWSRWVDDVAGDVCRGCCAESPVTMLRPIAVRSAKIAMRIAVRGSPQRGRSMVLRVVKNKAAGAPAECGLVWKNEGGLAEGP